uniref:Uncharacterized protein n=1 Tax=Arundo donax TaxID=35708 RepID=A0A0A9B8S9_ARUDO
MSKIPLCSCPEARRGMPISVPTCLYSCMRLVAAMVTTR